MKPTAILAIVGLGIAVVLLGKLVGGEAPEARANSEGWMTDLDAAFKKAKAENKLVLVDFTASWCGPCQMYKEDVFPTAAFKEATKDMILVEVDVDENQARASELGVSSIPDIRILSPKAEQQVGRMVGYAGDDLLKEIAAAKERDKAASPAGPAST